MGGGAGPGRAWWGRAPQLVMTKPASASARRLPGGCSAAAGGGGGGGEGGSVAAVGVAREEAPLPPSTMAAPRGRVHGMGGVRGEG